MRIRTDVIRMYKEVHSWVGIIAGLALFIAFYAGAITMFEESIQRWASPPSRLPAAVSLERTPELVRKVLAAHPEAAKRYEIALRIDGNRPARMSWTAARGPADEHAPPRTFYAALDGAGRPVVSEVQPSAVGQLIDVLHQQVGLPFGHEISMPIMGAISLLYVIAIVSGLVVLLPSLVDDLFAVRIGRNLKRMWLDVHNVLGLFSLPFHLVMALTAVVFAFHDQFYDAQAYAFGTGAPERPAAHAPPPSRAPLAPLAVVRQLQRQAPGFRPVSLGYGLSRDGRLSLRVGGVDPRYGLRGPSAGFVTLDPSTGGIKDTDYMPGHQDGWSAAITSFFALHFGNFGGTGVRWAYVLLGLAGAMLFYTGNLLWIESRRRRERRNGMVEQTRSTHILGALTVGVPLGCVAGISATVAAAKLLGPAAALGLHNMIYYAVFLAFVAGALARGSARAGVELAWSAALITLLVPAASLYAGGNWYRSGASPLVDIAALALAAALWLTGRAARRRALTGPRDSIWSAAHGAANTADLPAMAA